MPLQATAIAAAAAPPEVGYPGATIGPCRHCAARREPSRCPVAAVLAVALSHCDGSGQDRARTAAGPGRDADGREPGIPAGAGAPRAARRRLRLSWHVSRTGPGAAAGRAPEGRGPGAQGDLHAPGLAGQVPDRPQGPDGRDQRARQRLVPAGRAGPGRARDLPAKRALRQHPVPGDAGRAQLRRGQRGRDAGALAARTRSGCSAWSTSCGSS